MIRLVLERSSERLEVALLRDRELYRYEAENAPGSRMSPRAEAVYRARIIRCMPALEAAFVSLGADGNAYLPYREIRGLQLPPRCGEEIPVQIRREASGDKVPYVTMDLTLAGRGTLLLPETPRIAVSGAVEEAEKEALARRCGALCPQGCGLILRREAVSLSDDALREEINELLAALKALREHFRTLSGPGLIRPAPDLWERFWRDAHPAPEEIVANFPLSLHGLQAVQAQAPMDLFSVRDRLKKDLGLRHWLPGGGNLTLEKTEAFWAADVNTAHHLKKKAGLDETALQVNLEAARELARLLQVRNIGGIVVTDFVDMDEPAHREAVSAALREATAQDCQKVVLHGFTSLGLFELTRRRAGAALNPADTPNREDRS